MAGFSGYLVLDEMYDGPFCALSAVDGPERLEMRFADLLIEQGLLDL